MSSHKRGSYFKWIKRILLVLVIALFITGGVAARKYHQYIESITKHVTLDDDGYRVEITTFDKTVEDILDRYEIELGPGDEITPSPDEQLTKNTSIEIIRAMSVSCEADGEKHVVHLTKGTVQDVLDKVGVTLREDDLINISLNEQVKPMDDSGYNPSS